MRTVNDTSKSSIELDDNGWEEVEYASPKVREEHYRPCALLQWKSVSICMDVHCACGCHFHVDHQEYDGQLLQCPECKRFWLLHETVRMTEVKNPSGQYVMNGRDKIGTP